MKPGRFLYYCLYTFFFCIITYLSTSAQAANEDRYGLYMQSAINILKSNYVNKKDVNWKQFSLTYLTKSKKVKSISQLHLIVKQAIESLNDRHSFFAPITEITLSHSASDSPKIALNSDRMKQEYIGYIQVPFFVGTNEEKMLRFSKDLQEQIRKQDRKKLKGWIVDLRGNMGGNMWPMLAGIGPLLEGDTLGYFIYPGNSEIIWKYENGKSVQGNIVKVKIANPYHLIAPHPIIAVLTDSLTASSGEAVAIAFKGRNSTKSFGMRTAGVPTGIENFIYLIIQ